MQVVEPINPVTFDLNLKFLVNASQVLDIVTYTCSAGCQKRFGKASTGCC